MKLQQQQHGRGRIMLNAGVNGDQTTKALVRLPGLLDWIKAEAGAQHKYIVVGLSLASCAWCVRRVRVSCVVTAFLTPPN